MFNKTEIVELDYGYDGNNFIDLLIVNSWLYAFRSISCVTLICGIV